MLDSGNQISEGPVNYYSVFKSMVDTALARPPKAEVEAYWWRNGNKVGYQVRLTNLSGVTLSYENSATVHAIVYEDAHVKVTNRFGRDAVAQSINELAPNASATFTLESNELTDVNWDKLHFVVLVDYRPSESADAYDMLQAAFAQPISKPFAVYPDEHLLMVDPADQTIPPLQVKLDGPDTATWTAASSSPWISSTPISGSIAEQPMLTFVKDNLSPGWQFGEITFTTSDGMFSEIIRIDAYLGPTQRIYLPLIIY